MPLCIWNQNVEGLLITVLGRIDEEGVAVNHTFDQEAGTYKGLYIKDNCLIGAILINKEDERDELLGNIREKTHFDSTQEGQNADHSGEDECYVGEVSDENVSTELIDN